MLVFEIMTEYSVSSVIYSINGAVWAWRAYPQSYQNSCKHIAVRDQQKDWLYNFLKYIFGIWIHWKSNGPFLFHIILHLIPHLDIFFGPKAGSRYQWTVSCRFGPPILDQVFHRWPHGHNNSRRRKKKMENTRIDHPEPLECLNRPGGSLHILGTVKRFHAGEIWQMDPQASEVWWKDVFSCSNGWISGSILIFQGV